MALKIMPFADSKNKESAAILHLLFDDYDRAVLLPCRSTGSSLVERVLRLLVSGQLHMYFEIIQGGWDFETAREMIRAAMACHTEGRLALLQAGKE